MAISREEKLHRIKKKGEELSVKPLLIRGGVMSVRSTDHEALITHVAMGEVHNLSAAGCFFRIIDANGITVFVRGGMFETTACKEQTEPVTIKVVRQLKWALFYMEGSEHVLAATATKSCTIFQTSLGSELKTRKGFFQVKLRKGVKNSGFGWR